MGPVNVSVVIPYRSKGDPWRDKVTAWCLDRWQTLTGATPIVADTGLDPFCHASSINHGAREATGQLLVVADADTTVNPSTLAAALDVARSGGWALAERYCALTLEQSQVELGLDELVEHPDPEWLGVRKSWAGFLAIDRATFLDLGGYDERIWGWGPDDVAIAAKLETLLAPPTWVPGTVFHMWHERDLADTYGVEGYHAKRDLAEAYLAAKGDPAAMRAVMP